MNINKIAQTVYQKQAKAGKPRENGTDFSKDFLGSLEEKLNNSEAKLAGQKGKNEPASNAASENEYLYGISSHVAISSVRTVVSKAVWECEVKGISYRESDYVKICIEKGFVYKAQVDKEKETVYVEQKNDSGSVKGYEADPNQIDEDTKDELEEFALTAWRKALGQYADYVQHRIKNGPEKFAIGSTEFSIKEWDKLMEKLDEDIDAIQKEQEERIQKALEEQLKQKAEKTEVKEDESGVSKITKKKKDVKEEV